MPLTVHSILSNGTALQAVPAQAKPLLRRARAYRETKKLDDALKDYQQLLELEPDLEGTLNS